MNILSVSSLSPHSPVYLVAIKVNQGGKSVPDAGLEPATPCLQVRCSTNWANRADSPANHHSTFEVQMKMLVGRIKLVL